jgi:GTP:adenosylcobinamide-phosphate guanylyltransferase
VLVCCEKVISYIIRPVSIMRDRVVRVNYVNEKYLRAIADIDFAFFNVNTPDDLEKARNMAVRDETGA